ncbi:hypothetical protein [Kitasatospora sp. NBC_01302]|uniref:hypothetical protein n=1 Tax=Kitasatospora sp. NBC_01302 TaxID=2903575 RepID=UPI002E166CB3|nr:hypothetical protein OG294_39705 [Kitasatospora sp. NBC_01302]
MLAPLTKTAAAIPAIIGCLAAVASSGPKKGIENLKFVFFCAFATIEWSPVAIDVAEESSDAIAGRYAGFEGYVLFWVLLFPTCAPRAFFMST